MFNPENVKKVLEHYRNLPSAKAAEPGWHWEICVSGIAYKMGISKSFSSSSLSEAFGVPLGAADAITYGFLFPFNSKEGIFFGLPHAPQAIFMLEHLLATNGTEVHWLQPNPAT